VKDETDLRLQKRPSAWLLRIEVMNNVAGRGKGGKYFTFTFRYEYFFHCRHNSIYFMLYLPSPSKLSFGIDTYRSSEILANYFAVTP
jgi:hypothetical protein